MGEWWTYRLSDFLMFSPRTYGRLLEGYNAAYWPAQVVVLALMLAALWKARRATGVLFALAWAHVGYAFFWSRYAEIFTAAQYLAVACGVQALAMLAAGGTTARGAWWAAAVCVIYPAASVSALGRPWTQVEFVGFMPDPTALATIGFALALERPVWVRAALCVVPGVMLVFGWGTLVNLKGA